MTKGITDMEFKSEDKKSSFRVDSEGKMEGLVKKANTELKKIDSRLEIVIINDDYSDDEIEELLIVGIDDTRHLELLVYKPCRSSAVCVKSDFVFSTYNSLRIRPGERLNLEMEGFNSGDIRKIEDILMSH